MDVPCPTQQDVLAELEKVAPGVPFLALGQTVFWDEPMKAGVLLRSMELGHQRQFIAGVHDTDYFAKVHLAGRDSGYKALAHNDTSTKGLWSAAGEFSSLFGSETVVTREALLAAGAKLGRIQAERPGYMDEITEAYGWRGVVALNEESRITAEKPLAPLFPALYETLEWAVRSSLELIAGPHRQDSEQAADHMLAMVCDVSDVDQFQTLAAYYRRLLPNIYRLAAGREVPIETTTTTELLRFNSETCQRPRFEIFGLFVSPETREAACAAYDAAIKGTEIYTLDRFGTGAVPFDLYIPGIGRGTLRLGTRGGVVMTPSPVGFSYKKAPTNLAELASILERRFGKDCVVVGKAVTLIGMLAQEFVFVFHEGASSYVKRSRILHQNLASKGHPLSVNPILRIGLEPWDALIDCCAWFKLPEPMRRPFGVDELSGCSLSARWREVVSEQRQMLFDLAELRRPLELVRYLDKSVGGTWSCLASQYEGLHKDMGRLNEQVAEVKTRKKEVVEKCRAAVRDRIRAEEAKGDHWRAKIFERDASHADWAERERLSGEVKAATERLESARQEWRELQAEQEAIVKSEEAEKGRMLRRNIAFEAELTRARLIREIIITADGLEKAGHRPAAWWFSLVCPDGTWFRATHRRSHYRLEPIV